MSIHDCSLVHHCLHCCSKNLEKVNSLNSNVNSEEQENNEKINSLNSNVNSEEQENNDIIRWDQECDTCRTPYSQLSAKGKTTGFDRDSIFSFHKQVTSV
jgi:hypothetical protein